MARAAGQRPTAARTRPPRPTSDRERLSLRGRQSPQHAIERLEVRALQPIELWWRLMKLFQ
jgi:hypothetical protein